MIFFGEAVPLEVEGDDSSEVFNLFGEGGKAEGRVACPMYTEEESAGLSSSEDGSALDVSRDTSLR
jgi:hypothetical protein